MQDYDQARTAEEQSSVHDAFSIVVERVLTSCERRGSSLLTQQEMEQLSRLCTQQQEDQQRSDPLSVTAKATASAASPPSFGFADVDTDLIGQLIDTLQKQVTLASSVDFLQEGYIASQKKEIGRFDTWLRQDTKGSTLLSKLSLGLEATTILLFLMNSPGIHRSLINEDAIEASIVLLRHHLSKHLLPTLNQIGHITAVPNDVETEHRKGSNIAITNTPSMKTASAKKRRRSSAGNAKSNATIKVMKLMYPLLKATIGKTVQIMERLEVLVRKVSLDDQPLLNISTGALQTLELDPTLQADVTSSQPLREVSIALIATIFRQYPRHRTIIVEDLYPLMLKLPTSKRSMLTMPVQWSATLYPKPLQILATEASNAVPCIQAITALLLALIQSAVVQPHPVENLPQDIQKSTSLHGKNNTVVSGLTNCQNVSDTFAAHLLLRCSRKSPDGGASEFRPVLFHILEDLFKVLLVPEYPAADMLLLSFVNCISRELIKFVSASNNNHSSSKASTAPEATYINTILEAFGKICAAEARILKFHRERPVRISSEASCSLQLNEKSSAGCYCQGDNANSPSIFCRRCKAQYHSGCLALSTDAISDFFCDSCQMGRIVDFERERNTNMGDLGCSADLIDNTYCMRRLLIDYLSISTRTSGVAGLQDAYGFQLARWVSELDKKQTSEDVNDTIIDDNTVTTNNNDNKVWPLITRLLELWDPRESSDLQTTMLGGNSLHGMLQCLSDEGRSRIIVHIAATQSQLLVSYRSQVSLFVNQLIGNKKNAVIRKQALKAIEKVTDADPKLMIYPFVRNAVTKRFSDDAISVREAAVSLVGLYVVHSPAVANAFHQAFLVGLQDEGISVRKRTIKILRDILCSNPSYKGRAESCTAMLRMAADPKEDDGVRDAIHDLFLEVWLENGGEDGAQESFSPVTPDNKVSTKTPNKILFMGENEGHVEMHTAVTPGSAPSNNLSTPGTVRTMRSTERRVKKRQLQIRSEIAVEQMVEVVKAADTGEHLTVLFRDLLQGESDADKGRKTSTRRKQRHLEEDHCALLVDALFEILLRVEESRASPHGATPKDIVAVLRTIGVFTKISPSDVHRHLDTILPYLKADNGMSLKEEAIVVASLSEAISGIAPVLTKDELVELGNTSLAIDLANVTYRFGREALSSAIGALCALAHHKSFNKMDNPFKAKVLALSKTFYGYLLKHREDDNLATMKTKAKANLQRALSVLGSVCRYNIESFTDDALESSDDEDNFSVIGPENLTFNNFASIFEKIFMHFLAKDDTQVKCAALRGLCGVFIARPREMLRMDQTGLISEVMASGAAPALKLESLMCWRDILLTEESRIESGEAKKKMDAKQNITVSIKISGDQDADATLFGGILTSHASRLLQLTQVRDSRIRFAALDLVGHLLRQGQINPNETVPYLLALQGDIEEGGIRSVALKLLMIEGEKRPDMLRQRVYAGIKQAYAFQKHVYPEISHVSALVKAQSGGSKITECVFGKVYKECIASIRKQRRGLFSSLLRRFDLQGRKKTKDLAGTGNSKSSEEFLLEDLPLLSFTAQVLAYLPYKVSSDPLFIIYVINSSLALRGPELLERFSNFLRPYGLSENDEWEDPNFAEDSIEIAAKREIPHHAKEVTQILNPDFDTKVFSALCVEAAAQILLLRLKSFLRAAYEFNEARLFSFNPDSKEVAEKTISKAPTLIFDSTLSMESLGGSNDMADIDIMIRTYAEFRQRMREDSNSMAMNDIDEDDYVGNHDDAESRKRRRSSVGSVSMVVDTMVLSP